MLLLLAAWGVSRENRAALLGMELDAQKGDCMCQICVGHRQGIDEFLLQKSALTFERMARWLCFAV
jgi:hypothetical protein